MTEIRLAAAERTWLLEQVRATLFFAPSSLWPPSPLYERMVGELPAATQNPVPISVIQESGPFGAGTLIIGQRQDRIDIQVAMTPAAAAIVTVGQGEVARPIEEPRFAHLGKYQDVMPAFVGLIRESLHLFPNLPRIGILPVVFTEGPTAEGVDDIIAEMLPALRIPRSWFGDFTFKVNRRRASAAVADLDVNRIIAWNVMQAQTIQILIDQAGTSKAQTTPGSTFALRAELDINTDHQRKTSIPSERLQACLDELVTFAEQFMQQGDRP